MAAAGARATAPRGELLAVARPAGGSWSPQQPTAEQIALAYAWLRRAA